MTNPAPDPDDGFANLLARVRLGDAAAAAQLIQSCEAELRIIARARLRDPRLRRLVDSLDVCQSVLGAFFVRASAGEFELGDEQDILRLLARMIQNKVVDYARRQYAQTRDAGRLIADDAGALAAPAPGDTPSQIVAAEELASRFDQALAPRDRELLALRKNGAGWEELAARFGQSAEGLRKSHHRALASAAAEVGLLAEDWA